MRDSIEDYKQLTEMINGEKVTIFLDIIIRLTICRAYANSQARRFVTAEKLLNFGEKMINMVRNGEKVAYLVSLDHSNKYE